MRRLPIVAFRKVTLLPFSEGYHVFLFFESVCSVFFTSWSPQKLPIRSKGKETEQQTKQINEHRTIKKQKKTMNVVVRLPLAIVIAWGGCYWDLKRGCHRQSWSLQPCCTFFLKDLDKYLKNTYLVIPCDAVKAAQRSIEKYQINDFPFIMLYLLNTHTPDWWHFYSPAGH